MSLGKKDMITKTKYSANMIEKAEVCYEKKNYDSCSGSCCDFCGDCDSFRFGADTGINLKDRNDLL